MTKAISYHMDRFRKGTVHRLRKNLNPGVMGLCPLPAVKELLARAGLGEGTALAVPVRANRTWALAPGTSAACPFKRPSDGIMKTELCNA
jgi:hypothetical protein